MKTAAELPAADLLTIEEFSRACPVKRAPRTIRKDIADGLIAHVRVARRGGIRIPRSELNRLLTYKPARAVPVDVKARAANDDSVGDDEFLS